MREEKPWRLGAAIVTALTLHGAVAVVGSFLRRAPAPEGPAPLVVETEVDIEEAAPPVPPGAAPESSAADDEPKVAIAVPAPARGRADPGEPAPSEAPSSEARPPSEPPAASGDQGYAVNPAAPAPGAGPAAPGDPAGGRRRVDLGISEGDWSRYVDPSAPAAEPSAPRAERAPRPASSTGGLAEALEANDQRIGLGAAGPVLTAAHEAGHSERAPAIGTATFSVTVLRTGAIQVDLTGASSNVAAWRKVADDMAAAIRRKPPRIANGRNGVRLGIEIVAQERWPNGAIARSEGPSLSLSLGAIRSTGESQEDLARRNPAAVPPPGSPAEQKPLAANVEMPGVYLKGRGKVCGYQLGITPFGPSLSGGCDPSNIGARASRVVSAKVTEQTAL
jgi:hypothetical protein